MERTVMMQLKNWKNSQFRKPLILTGARQVGKTYVLKEFGKKEFKNVAYVNCDNNPDVRSLFDEDYDMKKVLMIIGAITKQPIVPGETLIILDEIQELPRGLSSLKYFCEEARQYHIIVAGSLLGVSLHGGTGFPVGKVDRLKMYPMTFSEFIEASGKVHLLELLESHRWEEISSLSVTYTDLLRQYYYVGGMPEVVDSYFLNYDLKEVRNIQNTILNDYEQDFSKHIPPALLAKVRMVWRSIPSQLSKENKKFVYGALKKGGRAKEFEDAIDWLIHAGLIHKVNRVNKIEKPLKFYEDLNAFKLFVLDLGLLQAMANVSAKEVLTDRIFCEVPVPLESSQ